MPARERAGKGGAKGCPACQMEYAIIFLALRSHQRGEIGKLRWFVSREQHNRSQGQAAGRAEFDWRPRMTSARRQVKLLMHKADQLLPATEADVAGEGSQVVEEGTASAQFLSHFPVDRRAEPKGGMAEESQQEQGEQNHGEILLAMAIVVTEVVTTVLEDVEALVLDLPATAARGYHLDDALLVEVKVSRPGITIQHLTRALIGDSQLAPVDYQSIRSFA